MADQRIVNLCFHGIGEPSRRLEENEDRYWVSKAFFEEVLDYAAGRPRVRISFDDGNASDFEAALPALLKRRMRATFFPLAARLDEPGSLRRSDVRELSDQGMTIGSHGMTHRQWRRLTPELQQQELVSARQQLESASGSPVRAVACPFGIYDRRTLAALRRLGYEQVFTSDRATATERSWFQPRFTLDMADDLNSVRAIVEAVPRPLAMAKDAVRMAVKKQRW
jgi:peptidoglycan/xylan/chitin deacetylase (PgdA/CDA1 family)